VPASAVVTPVSTGFCVDEEKLFGPTQAYVALPTALAAKLRLLPEHTGLLLLNIAAAGVCEIVTATVPVGLVQLPIITNTE